VFAPAVASMPAFLLFFADARSGHSLIGSLIDAHPHAVVSNEANVLEQYVQEVFPSIDAAADLPKKVSAADWREHAVKLAPALVRERALARVVDNAVWCGLTGRYQTDYLYSVPGAYSGQWTCDINVIGDKKGLGTRVAVRALSKVGALELFGDFVDALAVDALKIIIVRTTDAAAQTSELDPDDPDELVDSLRSELAWPRPAHGTRLDVLRVDDFACAPDEQLRRICAFLGLSEDETFLAAATATVNTGYCHRTGTRTPEERVGAVGLDRFG
jgi:hypothetical protein